ncbi:hypothetical protein AB1N83_011186 [Pleurotus pulmonarius]
MSSRRYLSAPLCLSLGTRSRCLVFSSRSRNGVYVVMRPRVKPWRIERKFPGTHLTPHMPRQRIHDNDSYEIPWHLVLTAVEEQTAPDGSAQRESYLGNANQARTQAASS